MIVLKVNFSLFMKIKEETLCLEQNVNGWNTVDVRKNFFSMWRNEIIIRRLLVNFDCRTNQRQPMKRNFWTTLKTTIKIYLHQKLLSPKLSVTNLRTQHLEIPKLSDQDRDSLEGPLSCEEECKN